MPSRPASGTAHWAKMSAGRPPVPALGAAVAPAVGRGPNVRSPPGSDGSAASPGAGWSVGSVDTSAAAGGAGRGPTRGATYLPAAPATSSIMAITTPVITSRPDD